jgi:prevent-host-death family protein
MSAATILKRTFSSREANQDFGRAKKASSDGPVIITDRGRPTHVLMTFEEFESRMKPKRNAAEALAMPGGEDIEFDPPVFRDIVRPADFS